MKYTTRCAVISSIVGLTVLSLASAEDAQQMIAEAKALDQRFVMALNAADVDTVMTTYWNSPELVNFGPDAMIARGWSAVKDGFAQMFAQMPGATFELTESHNTIAGDVVLGWGLWRMTVPLSDGGSTTTEGRYTDVKAKRNGKWVLILDHASAPLAPPESSSEQREE